MPLSFLKNLRLPAAQPPARVLPTGGVAAGGVPRWLLINETLIKLVIAIGGNALLRQGQAPTAANLLGNVRMAAAQLAKIASIEIDGQAAHQIVLTHGSGPQVGLLALQSAAYAAQNPGTGSNPLDMLDAEVAGMLGYVLEQEIANLLP